MNAGIKQTPFGDVAWNNVDDVPCPVCGEAGDLTIYEHGGTYCFICDEEGER
jgi:hypothetical protein